MLYPIVKHPWILDAIARTCMYLSVQISQSVEKWVAVEYCHSGSVCCTHWTCIFQNYGLISEKSSGINVIIYFVITRRRPRHAQQKSRPITYTQKWRRKKSRLIFLLLDPSFLNRCVAFSSKIISEIRLWISNIFENRIQLNFVVRILLWVSRGREIEFSENFPCILLLKHKNSVTHFWRQTQFNFMRMISEINSHRYFEKLRAKMVSRVVKYYSSIEAWN